MPLVQMSRAWNIQNSQWHSHHRCKNIDFLLPWRRTDTMPLRWNDSIGIVKLGTVSAFSHHENGIHSKLGPLSFAKRVRVNQSTGWVRSLYILLNDCMYATTKGKNSCFLVIASCIGRFHDNLNGTLADHPVSCPHHIWWLVFYESDGVCYLHDPRSNIWKVSPSI